MIATLFDVMLLLATLLCSLVAGLLFAFAVVVMPGIGSMDDAGFIHAFQAIDRVIQNNRPLFVLVWAGSVATVIAAAVLGMWAVAGADRMLLVAAALAYVLGVQAPTGLVNVPLNNQLQSVDVAAMTDTARRSVRQAFERRWNRWNVIRTAVAVVVSALLLLVRLSERA